MSTQKTARSGSGARHWKAKLTTAEIDFARELHEDYGWGYKLIAAVFGVPVQTIASICKYRRRCVG